MSPGRREEPATDPVGFASVTPPPEPEPEPTSHRRRWVAAAALAVLLVVGLGAGAAALLRGDTPGTATADGSAAPALAAPPSLGTGGPDPTSTTTTTTTAPTSPPGVPDDVALRELSTELVARFNAGDGPGLLALTCGELAAQVAAPPGPVPAADPLVLEAVADVVVSGDTATATIVARPTSVPAPITQRATYERTAGQWRLCSLR